MSDQPETLAAIIAEMRDFAKPRRVGGDLCSNIACPATISIWADRIEAAYKREHAEWHAETDAAKEARNRIACKMRYEFAAKCRACKAAPGNAAALREAMEELVYRKCLVQGSCGKPMGELCTHTGCIWHPYRAALAAPARNCDISRDTKETIERCLASLDVESSSASFDAGVCAAIGWMLAAPAKEAN